MNTAGLNDADWERYRAFLAVFETGSLSAAARQLNTVQPTARRRIKALEKQLDIALCTRSPSGLACELIAPARAMAAAANAFLRTPWSQTDTVSGVVRVAASEVMGIEILPPILGALMAGHPETDSDAAQLAAIRAGVGVGVCQIPLARREPELVHILPDLFAYPLETWVVMHEDLRRVHRIRHVFRHLVTHLSAYARMDTPAE